MSLCTGLLEVFQKDNEVLEKIAKSLEDYLETKRMAFPRFYFLSNEELIEILAQVGLDYVQRCSDVSIVAESGAPHILQGHHKMLACQGNLLIIAGAEQEPTGGAATYGQVL